MIDIVIRLLMALEAIVCLMLIGIILIQKSKGQGMGLSFGSGSAEAVFGAQMGNVLTRTTVLLAIIFLVNTTILAVLKPKGVSASVVDHVKEEPVATVPTLPESSATDLEGMLEPTADAASALVAEEAPAAPAVEAPAAPAVEAPAAPAVEAPAAPAVEAPAAPAAEAPAAPAVEAPAAPAVEAPAAPAA